MSSPSSPILIGQPNGAVLRARVTIGINSLRAGDTGYFTGTGVDALVTKSILVPVP